MNQAETKPKAGRRRRQEPLTDADRAELALLSQLLNEGMTFQDAAMVMDIPRNSLLYRLKNKHKMEPYKEPERWGLRPVQLPTPPQEAA